MRQSLAIIALLIGIAFLGAREAPSGDAAFHIMRVYGVMGGANGDSDVQYVELRLAAGGQSLVGGHDICFYDGAGVPYARFTFPSHVPNGADQASILIGTSGFDALWGGTDTPDFQFLDDFPDVATPNTVSLLGTPQGSAPDPDVDQHPIVPGAGKVAFGSDSATNPAMMCGSYFLVDSVAYSNSYAGPVDYGADPSPNDLPTAGTTALILDEDPVTFGFQDNEVDYILKDVNVAADYPRNNSGDEHPVSAADADGDTVPDATDNCPLWPNPGQGMPPWPVMSGDDDCDGFSGAHEGMLGTAPGTACGFTAGAPTESENWPPDLLETNNINIQDINVLKSPFGQTVPPASSRLEMLINGSINIQDINALKPFFGMVCTP